jgi:hypothetical protein
VNEPTLKRCVAALTGKQAAINRRFAYYDGAALLPVITDRLREVYHQFNIVGAENWSAVVVDCMTDRIALRGLHGPDDATTALLADAWSSANLALETADAHEAALVGGEAYLIAWRDEDGPIECYYNDPRACHVFYDMARPNVPSLACKWWDDEEESARFLKIYTADEIATYRAVRRSFDTERADATRFLPVDAPAPNPFGVIPVFHLRPRRRPISEMDAIISIQDGINILLANMLVTAEFNAAPMKYIISNATGLEDLVSAPNRIWTIPSGDALGGSGGSTQVGQFGAADLGNYLSAIEHYISALSSVTRTPKHYFQLQQGRNAPSGEALEMMDGPLVKKCRDRMDRFTPTYRALGAFLCQLQGVQVDPATIRVDWANPETEQPLQQAQETTARAQAIAAKRQAGMSRKQGLRELGYTEDQIVAMDTEEASDPHARVVKDVIDLVDAQLLSHETGMAQVGVADPAAEAERIQAEQEASASLGGQVINAFNSGQ